MVRSSSSRRRARLAMLVGTAQSLATTSLFAAVPGFPGLDGAGATTTGGSGGSVYHVTVLDTKLGDTTPGTLQYGLSHTGGQPTTIVFDVGGTIWLGLKTTDVEGWDTQNSLNIPSNVTIAGQTAPGGITFMGSQIKVNGTTTAGQTLPQANVIIRNVTMAVGYGVRKANSTSGYYDNYTYDNMDINSDHVVVDHVKALYSTDESISANEMANHVTVQYSTLAQGQSYPQADAQGGGAYKAHALGDLWGLGSNAVSTFSHNLYANESGRIPTLQTVATKLSNNIPAYTDFRNNVVYNWFGTAGYGSSGEPGAGEFEGNYYKVGPGGDTASDNATDFSIHTSTGGTTVFTNSTSTQVYQTGNVRANLNGTTTNLVNSNFGSAATFQSGPYPQIPYNGVTDSAATAYNQVLNYVGPDWQNRDAIDQRLINEVTTGSGKIAALDDPNNGYNSAGQYIANSPNNPDLEWNRLLGLRSTADGGTGATGATYTRPANFDTDGDGMPDTWEIAMGTNPNVPDNNGSVMNDGYTNLDAYLNELAAWPASTPLIFSNGNGNGRYAEIGNWQTGVYKPTRFDTVQVDTGTASIDVVGQHAGILSIATNTGNTAALSVSNGWLEVSQTLLVGPAGSGSLNQTGGAITAASIIVGSATGGSGTFTQGAGGTLNVTTSFLNRGTTTLAGTQHWSAGATFTNTAGTASFQSDAGSAASSTLTLNAMGGLVTFSSNQHLAALNLSSTGHVSITSAASWASPTVVTLGTLGIDHSGGAALDLTNNELLVNASTSSIRSLISSGAMTTSTATLALGYLSLDAGQIEVRATLFGDTNLDGNVNVADLGNLATNFGLTAGGEWVQGDFDYNGTVNVADLGDLATNFGQSLGGGTAVAAISSANAVPEPGSLGLLLGAASLLTGRRRTSAPVPLARYAGRGLGRG